MNTIQISGDLISIVKNKHLLLDVNVFRDSATKSSVYTDFFNNLKSNSVSLATIDLVKYEALKGSADLVKYDYKEKIINDIVDVLVPISPITYQKVYELIKDLGMDGSPISITDLFLGAMLIQFSPNIFLMTRDTTDFIQRVFELVSIINVPHSKGIFTYGVYKYHLN